jgi:hypothetical protein
MVLLQGWLALPTDPTGHGKDLPMRKWILSMEAVDTLEAVKRPRLSQTELAGRLDVNYEPLRRWLGPTPHPAPNLEHFRR